MAQKRYHVLSGEEGKDTKEAIYTQEELREKLSEELGRADLGEGVMCRYTISTKESYRTTISTLKQLREILGNRISQLEKSI